MSLSVENNAIIRDEMAPILNLGPILQDVILLYTGTASIVKTGYRKGYAILKTSGVLTLASPAVLDIFVVGGGGGTGHGNGYTGGAGGAGGGYNTLSLAQSLAAGDYTVTIGAGGTKDTNLSGSGNTWGTNGSASSFVRNGVINIVANGGSATYSPPAYSNGTVGGSGGSGGGGGSGSWYSTSKGGGGGVNGANGGTSDYTSGSTYGAVGGVAGGAGSGVNGTLFRENTAQCGYGATDYFGAGGPGGSDCSAQTMIDTGRAYKWSGLSTVRDAVANTGCGGGGGYCTWGGANGAYGTNGGSGIVVVRWNS